MRLRTEMRGSISLFIAILMLLSTFVPSALAVSIDSNSTGAASNHTGTYPTNPSASVDKQEFVWGKDGSGSYGLLANEKSVNIAYDSTTKLYKSTDGIYYEKYELPQKDGKYVGQVYPKEKYRFRAVDTTQDAVTINGEKSLSLKFPSIVRVTEPSTDSSNPDDLYENDYYVMGAIYFTGANPVPKSTLSYVTSMSLSYRIASVTVQPAIRGSVKTSVKSSLPNLKSFTTDKIDKPNRNFVADGNGSLYRFNSEEDAWTLYCVPPARSGKVKIASELTKPDNKTAYPVSRLGEYAFYGCSKITDISLPETIKHIDYHVTSEGQVVAENYLFYNTANLQNFYLYNGETESTNLASSSADKGDIRVLDGVLYNKDLSVLYCYPRNRTTTSFTIPTNTSVIAHNAFNGCSALKTINLNNYNNSGSKVRYLGQYAFEGCSSGLEINYNPEKYYTRPSSKSTSEFITNALNANGVIQRNGDTKPVYFSLGYSQCFLTGANNDIKTGIQNWYSNLYQTVSNNVDAQVAANGNKKVTDEAVGKIDSFNKTFLNMSDLLKAEEDRLYHEGVKNATDESENSGSYLTKAGKWSNDEKTKAQVAINYTYGSDLTGANFVLVLDKTASMASSAEPSSDTFGEKPCPASRLYSQYSITYNMAKGLTNNKKANNSVSIITFSGDIDGKAYAKILCNNGLANNMLVCDGTSGNTLDTKVSEHTGSTYCVSDINKIEDYLNHIDLTLSGTGTWYTHGMSAVISVLDRIHADSSVSDKLLPVIFSSDGGPSDTESAIKEKSAVLRDKCSALYTVLNVDFRYMDGDSYNSAKIGTKTAMGWVTDIIYNENNNNSMVHYNQYNKLGSDKTSLISAFKEIYKDTMAKSNVVIKDMIEYNNFRATGDFTFDVQKWVTDYDVIVDTGPYYSDKSKTYISIGGTRYYCKSITYDGKSYKHVFSVPDTALNKDIDCVHVENSSSSLSFDATFSKKNKVWHGENLNVKIAQAGGTTIYFIERLDTDAIPSGNGSYENHSFKLNLTPNYGNSSIYMLRDVVCRKCGKSYSSIFSDSKSSSSSTDDETIASVRQSDAYIGWYYSTNSNRDSVELHLPYANCRDIYTLTMNLNLNSGRVGNNLNTNYDMISDKSVRYNGCFVYNESDIAVGKVASASNPVLPKVSQTAVNVNNVETPVLSKDSPTFDVNINLSEEYYDYANKTYDYTSGSEFGDGSTYKIEGIINNAVCSTTTATISNGTLLFTDLPQHYIDENGNATIIDKYIITRTSSPVGKRYIVDNKTYTINKTDIASAVTSSDALSFNYHDDMLKGSLLIKKEAFDNQVSDVWFSVKASDSKDTAHGTYESTIKTNTSGVTTELKNLPIYDTADKLIDYNIKELGLYNSTTKKYTIPSRYLVPNDQVCNLNTNGSVLNVTFKNEAAYGKVKITKTSEDNIVSNIAFLLSGGNVNKIVTTNTQGKAVFNDLLVYDSNGNKITYTVTELGVLKSGASSGSQNVNDYVFPDRYKPQSPKTLTINAPNTTKASSFYNELIPGSIKIIKKSSRGDLLAGVEFVLVDNNENVVPLDVSSDKHSAVYNKNGSTNYNLVTDSNGEISITNLTVLQSGEYKIKETKTLNGYNLLKDCVSVTGMTYKNPDVTKIVYDSDKLNLPHTGGHIFMFAILGGILLIGAGAFIYKKRKHFSL